MFFGIFFFIFLDIFLPFLLRQKIGYICSTKKQKDSISQLITAMTWFGFFERRNERDSQLDDGGAFLLQLSDQVIVSLLSLRNSVIFDLTDTHQQRNIGLFWNNPQ